MINRFFIIWLAFFSFSSICMASDSRVMILNSNRSIVKYKQLSRDLDGRFEDKLSINLDSKWAKESVIENKIIDYNPDVIITVGASATELASRLASDKPRVFLQTINWDNKRQPHNVYGIQNTVSDGYQLSTFKYFFKSIKTITVFYNPDYNKSRIRKAVKLAKRSNIILKPIPVNESKDLKRLLPTALSSTDALWIIPDPEVLSDISSVKRLFKAANSARVPVFAYDSSFVKFGASLIVTAESKTMVNQVVQMTKQIVEKDFRGSQVKSPAGTRVIINLKQLSKLEVEYSDYALHSVNEIIE